MSLLLIVWFKEKGNEKKERKAKKGIEVRPITSLVKEVKN